MRGVERDNQRGGASRWTSGWRRLTRIWQSDSSANVDEELRFHFEQKVAEFVAAGANASDARARAEAEFGDVESVRESLRSIDARIVKRQQRAEWWESVAQDLRYVVRSLRRSPMFTVTVVVTLSLGLGANAALFSLLNTLYVQTPNAVPEPEALRRVYYRSINRGELYTREVFDYTQFRLMQDAAPAGIVLAGYTQAERALGRASDDPKVNVDFITGDYFGVLGLRPLLGRYFSPDEYAINGYHPVAIISESLWQRRYLRARDVLGKTIQLGDHQHQIIGVASSGFHGTDLDAVDVWAPKNTSGTLRGRKDDWYTANRGTLSTRIIARVPGEATAKVFDARATNAMRSDKFFNPDSAGVTFFGSIIEARNSQQRSSQIAISTRLGGVALVILLIACANVINLLLARANVRRREIALRLALGVSRGRLIGQLVTESLVLAFLAGIVAIGIGYEGAHTLRTLLLPTVKWADAAINLRVTLFLAAAAISTGMIAGIVPALQASRADLSNSLKTSTRDGGTRGSRLRSSLLIVQAGLSIVLLAGAGVFVRSMHSVENIDIGFDTDRLVFASADYDHELESHEQEISAKLPQAAERIRRIPGVEMVAMASNVPMYGISFSSLFLPDRDSLPPSGKSGRFKSVVSPEFFSAVGMRVLRGRGFTEGDRIGSEPVLIMNEALAQNLWPGQDPLTKCLIVSARTEPCRRVVGIVSPAHYTTSLVESDVAMSYYLPLQQTTATDPPGAIVVRAKPGQTHKVALAAARAVGAEMGNWSKPSSMILADMLAPSLRSWRIGAALFTAAGFLALLVAAVGIYSSMAYTFSQRAQEMGVRVALGASSQNIMRLVVSDGVRVVAIGVALGIVIALALGSLVASMLYHTSPRDPFVLVTSAMTLLAVAVVACAIPGWRASRVDPLSAMRAE